MLLRSGLNGTYTSHSTIEMVSVNENRPLGKNVDKMYQKPEEGSGPQKSKIYNKY